MERAAQLAAYAQRYESSFATYFGRPAPSYAVVELSETSPPDVAASLRSAGFEVVQPWQSRQAQIDAQVNALRQALERATAAGRLQPEQAAAALQQNMDRLAPKHTDAAMAASEAATIPHELGHMGYIRAYWPDADTAGQSHYGGPGPDWMDEVAALLMETPETAEDRRRGFAAVIAGSEPGSTPADANSLRDLTGFVTGEHPMKATLAGLPGPAQQSASAPSGAPRAVAVVRGSGMPSAGLFYLRGRLFADFLLEKTGGDGLFGSIGSAVGQGETFESWLSREGASHNLPTTLTALDEAWRQWLQSKGLA